MKQNELKDLDKVIKNIHDYGCYFLDLIYVSKDYKEPTLEEMLKYYDIFLQKMWIDSECFVANPTAILEYLTGKKYRIKIDSVFDKQADIIIGRWYNPTTNYHHFVVMDKCNEVRWDSIENSNTVKNGFIESYRLFYLEK